MKPLIIGLTGGIGSGKSVVAQLLSLHGFLIYDSDREAKRIMHENPHVIREIKHLFGDEAYIDQQLNRPYIAQKAFPNPQLLAQLNAIVHPAVGQDLLLFCQKSTQPVVVESAILFDCDLINRVNQTILVTAPLSLRIKRVAQRSGLSEEEIAHRIAAQTPDEELITKATYVIRNDERESLIEQVSAIVSTIKSSVE